MELFLYKLVDQVPHRSHGGEVIDAISKGVPRVSLGTLLEGYQLVSRLLILAKMDKSRMSLKNKATLHCLPFCLKYTAIERSGTSPRVTGEMRSDDIENVKVVS